MTRRRKVVIGIPLACLLLLLLIQLVPYGRDHSNPPVTGSPDWDSPLTEQLARRACFDCHSNETQWPWYASFAPLSWRIQRHVDEGRSELNFSRFDQPQKEAHEAAEVVEIGEMPLRDYLRFHPLARLSDDEKQALIQGFKTTFSEHRGDQREDHAERENDG